jgi:hypothetical protein
MELSWLVGVAPFSELLAVLLGKNIFPGLYGTVFDSGRKHDILNTEFSKV